MTTNVTDLISKAMACDSRWSLSWPIARPRFILYIDDAGCEKIVTSQELAFIFAGDGPVIQKWKDWIATEPTSFDDMPPVDGLVVCMVDMDAAEVLFARGRDFVEYSDGTMTSLIARFAGSGASPARACWSKNRDPRKAVATAKQVDMASGGKVGYLDFSTRKCNLRGSARLEDVHALIKTKGSVMYMDKKTIPVKTAMEQDAEVKEVIDMVTAGQMAASAPCPGMHEPWTDDERGAFKKALTRLVGRKSKI